MGILNTEKFDIIIEFLLMIVLFSNHLTKKRHKYIFCFTIALLSLTFLYLLPVQGVLVIVDLFLCIIFISFLLEEKWYEKITSFLLIYILSSLIYQCFALIMDLIFKFPIFSGMNTYKEKNITKVLVILFLLIFIWFKNRIHYRFILSFVEKIFLCCYTGIICIILTVFHLNQNIINLTFLNLFSILCIVSVGILFSYLTAVSKKNLDLETLYKQKQYIVILKSYYDKIKENTFEIRKLRHDYRNHINVLKGLLKSNNTEQALKYIQSIENNVTHKVTRIPDVGNTLVNALLLQKILEFPDIEILFKGTISNDLGINDYDLCTILSNLLDNALEYSALHNFTTINLYMYQEATLLLIRIENFLTAPININSFKKSSKSNSQIHGLGLINVQETLEHYKGSLEYTQDHLKLIANVQLFLEE